MPGKKRPRRERIHHHQSHRANPVLSWCKQPRCSEPVDERRSPHDEKRGGARVLIVPLTHAWLLRREEVHEALYHIDVSECFPLAKEEENMATIELTENTLIVRVEGVDKFFTFKSQLEVPLSHVVGAEGDPLVVQEWGNWWKGVRIPGAHVPGVLAAGNFYQHGERVFWDVHDPQKAVTIRLADEQYAKLVIEVEDPARTITAIEEAVHRHQTA